MGDSRHAQIIQINKAIGENEKGVFYFTEKTKRTFWPTQYYPCFVTEETDTEERLNDDQSHTDG